MNLHRISIALLVLLCAGCLWAVPHFINMPDDDYVGFGLLLSLVAGAAGGIAFSELIDAITE